MSFIVRYQVRKCHDEFKFSSVLNFFTDKPSFRLKIYVGKVRENLLLSVFLGNCSALKSF